MSLGPLMVGVSGLSLTPEEREMLRHPLIGGVILFSRNYGDPDQLGALVETIHAIKESPLLVAVDHEGGRVQRFRDGFIDLPPMRRLGHIYDKDVKKGKYFAQLIGWLMAAELRAVGVDMSFAPVLDLDCGSSEVIGDRAFHSDPEAVADLAHAFMVGMDMAGMMAVGKHFPGHGTAAADSHLVVVTDNRHYEDIAAEDLLPFERMIHFGLAAVMAAHVVYPRVDVKPAGFSRFWMHDVLRQRLGFQGAIFSDDLGMAGAGMSGDIQQRAAAALDAGCDMILLCNELAEIPALLAHLHGYRNPASQLRLARLHGRGKVDRIHLRLEPTWQEALQAVSECGRPDEPDLV
jgi:beta-N-acetylhexosaminidase